MVICGRHTTQEVQWHTVRTSHLRWSSVCNPVDQYLRTPGQWQVCVIKTSVFYLSNNRMTQRKKREIIFSKYARKGQVSSWATTRVRLILATGIFAWQSAELQQNPNAKSLLVSLATVPTIIQSTRCDTRNYSSIIETLVSIFGKHYHSFLSK